MEKAKMIKLANDLLFDVKEEVFELLNEEHENIKKQLTLLNKFNLDNIEPMTHINEAAIDFDLLREDEPKQGLAKDKLLDNAFDKDADFVKIRKVIND
ncbi:Asp-tRNA(Asn)/Glu-tRNA(Gln) amidotransferase subunit GatC [[Mycoplasma] gypis]|uniref:Glutamyl-tRNA amidotransferase n=1 Tax=[Mycoplasma] gypis TaxID=92404 RepID=A0ABZ2RNZ1_9BACT|nr:glutamyl-tRNA amidotransferase [[Mycoplasma] gypis]MBN0919253.1 glutamyl-tRNA amidotransferase [[Mycoplasma] gypis]